MGKEGLDGTFFFFPFIFVTSFLPSFLYSFSIMNMHFFVIDITLSVLFKSFGIQ